MCCTTGPTTSAVDDAILRAEVERLTREKAEAIEIAETLNQESVEHADQRDAAIERGVLAWNYGEAWIEEAFMILQQLKQAEAKVEAVRAKVTDVEQRMQGAYKYLRALILETDEKKVPKAPAWFIFEHEVCAQFTYLQSRLLKALERGSR